MAEDWYQIKMNHNQELKEWGIKNKHIFCLESKECVYINRYQRNRENEVYTHDSDIKNVILMDQIDSIHAYIFHASRRDTSFDRIKSMNETKNGLDNVISVITHRLSDKLINYEQDIINWIKDSNINEDTLKSMGRKTFANDLILVLKLENNKLKHPLCKLYNDVIMELTATDGEEKDSNDELWSIQPQSISECSVKQIQWLVVNKILVDIDKLQKYSEKIVNYLEDNSIDGIALSAMNRKEFMNRMKEYLNLNDNKLRAALGQLYSKTIKHTFPKENSNPGSDLTSNQNSKFVTETRSKSQNYELGVQYKYTKDFIDHPWFIHPKHGDIKEELFEYFMRINKENDLRRLKYYQSDYMSTMHSSIKFVLEKLISATRHKVTDSDMDALYTAILDDQKTEYKHNNEFNAMLFMKFCYNIITGLCMNVEKETIHEFNKMFMEFMPWGEIQKNLQQKISGMDLMSSNTIQELEMYLEEISGTYIAMKNCIAKQQNEIEERNLVMGYAAQLNRFIAFWDFKSKLLNCTKIILQRIFDSNERRILEYEQNKRIKPFIKICDIKMEMNSIKQMRAYWYQNMNVSHTIYPNDPIRKKHVLSLIMYTQCSNFCTVFRETYRKQRQNETEKEQMQRHVQYAHFGRCIYESFAFYASKNGKIKVLYHGISIAMSFSNLYCAFNAPTSTTTSSAAASSFGGGNGIVIMMDSADSQPYIRSLDMALFTCYDHEEEQLIFETRCHIKDIWITSQRKFIGKKIMNTLSLYDQIIHGTIIDNSLIKNKIQTTLNSMLLSVMKDSVSTFTTSSYVNTLVMSLIKSNRKIWINSTQINKLTNDALRNMFVLDEKHTFGDFISYLQQNYEVIVCPIFVSKWIVNQNTFDQISKLSKNQSKKVQITYNGPVLKCMLSESKSIVFQPQLIKINNLYHTEMKLINTYEGLPITVHFNIECNGEIDYFSSLHPRRMTTQWGNVFHIQLPIMQNDKHVEKERIKLLCCNRENSSALQKKESEETMQVTFYTMLHNFEEFKIDPNITDVNNTMQEVDMQSSAQFYAVTDILSTFYGISNSVFSCFDSISDIYFIIFLFQSLTPTTYFLIILSFGNLLCTAIGMAFYLAINLNIESYLKRLGLSLVLFALSPALPAVEWVIQQFDSIGSHVLVMRSGKDGVLLWFEEERVKNKLFIIETISESCFQIIIQFIAIFVVHGYEYQYIYLWMSIATSIIVILSKLILLSYNPHRTVIALNLFTYFVDIYLCLLSSMFIGAFVFQKIFNFVGFYMIMEMLLFVPFITHFIFSRGDILDMLQIPFLMLFWYPFALCILPFGFSMHTFWNKCLTNPEKIGSKQKFHEEMYRYCCASQSKREFDFKLIIINYVCIHMYFNALKQIKNKKDTFYEFAQELNSLDLSKLEILGFDLMTNYKLKEVRYLSGYEKIDVLLIFKSWHVMVRCILIVICICLDLFYSKIFVTNSAFSNIYGNIIGAFTAVGICLFGVWVVLFNYDMFGKPSDWHKFCHYMITSKHEDFVLTMSMDDFKQKCDDIFQQAFEQDAYETNVLKEWRLILTQFIKGMTVDHRVSLLDIKDDEFTQIKWIKSVLLLLIQIITIIILSKSYCFQARLTMSMYSTAVLLIHTIVCGFNIYKQCQQRSNHNAAIIQCILFAVSTSQLVVFLYVTYFYFAEQCSLQIGGTIIMSLFSIQCFICLIPWRRLLDVVQWNNGWGMLMAVILFPFLVVYSSLVACWKCFTRLYYKCNPNKEEKRLE
eukprot:488690_1